MDWSTWSIPRRVQLERLTARLKRELGPGHRLFPVADHLNVVALDTATDDILAFQVSGGSTAYLIHLTWAETAPDDPAFVSTVDVQLHDIPVWIRKCAPAPKQ